MLGFLIDGEAFFALASDQCMRFLVERVAGLDDLRASRPASDRVEVASMRSGAPGASIPSRSVGLSKLVARTVDHRSDRKRWSRLRMLGDLDRYQKQVEEAPQVVRPRHVLRESACMITSQREESLRHRSETSNCHRYGRTMFGQAACSPASHRERRPFRDGDDGGWTRT